MKAKLGDSWQDTVHPDDLEATKKEWAQSIRTGEPYLNEHRMRTADGSWHSVRVRATARRGEFGEVIGWYGLVEDIELHKRAGNTAGDANKQS